MRPFEVTILILLGLYIFWPLLFKRRGFLILLLPVGAVLAMLFHFLLERYRWQMVPMYILVIVYFFHALVLLLRSRYPETGSRLHALQGFLIGVLLLGIATALPALLPVPSTLEPEGDFPVGTFQLYLIDESRAEVYSPEPGGPRRLMVQVWYPAENTIGLQRALWLEHAELLGPNIMNRLGMDDVGFPTFFFDHIALARGYAYKEAPERISEGPYPVLFFSHGWGGLRTQNTSQMENLASHGYVVVAVDHTYGAAGTVFPDEEIAVLNRETLPFGLPDEEYQLAANMLVHQWAGDIAFLRNYFVELQSGGESLPEDVDVDISRILDTSRTGYLGHSTGGGAIATYCSTTGDCGAVLGMDPYLEPLSDENMENGADAPTLFLFSEGWAEPERGDDAADFLEKTQPEHDVFAAVITGSMHYDFTDLALFSPLATRFGLSGDIDSRRMLTIVNQYSVAFFDTNLKEDASAHPELLFFPEVEIWHIN